MMSTGLTFGTISALLGYEVFRRKNEIKEFGLRKHSYFNAHCSVLVVR